LSALIAGAVFGRLTVISVGRGAKNKHPRSLCQCACGQRVLSRNTDIRNGRKTSCKTCAWRAAWAKRPRSSAEERLLGERESQYKINARTKDNSWTLTRAQFRRLATSACVYCGKQPAYGVDRVDNREGYTILNSAPCCSACNFAKRDMRVEDFLDLIRRISTHCCFI
jgi:hypothetical protein